MALPREARKKKTSTFPPKLDLATLPMSSATATSNSPNDTDPPPPPGADPASFTAFTTLMARGRTHLMQSELELGLQAFTAAQSLCTDPTTGLSSYTYTVIGNLGWINRMLGRYEKGLSLLQDALALADAVGGPSTPERVHIIGETGTLYRLMGRHGDAVAAFAAQYEAAKERGWDRLMCRAIGNLGMANSQRAIHLWETRETRRRTDKDGNDEADHLQVKGEVEALLRTAMEQLQERVTLAKGIWEVEHAKRMVTHKKTTRMVQMENWECIALCRLSLCYITMAAIDDDDKRKESMMEKAVRLTKNAVSIASRDRNSSVLPLARLFYGRALLARGDKEGAMQQFNPPPSWYWVDGVSTPAMALCQEPSAEHRGYLKELIQAGADFEITDELGYTALDHAVFSGDVETELLVVEGLTKQLGDSDEAREGLADRRDEARRRKGYREIFQERLRPVLLEGGENCVQKLRREYADALIADPDKKTMFDHLKFIRYEDFAAFGRLPRSTDSLVRVFDNEGRKDGAEFLIFFSYRWINSGPGLNTPDDVHCTQYRRMLSAAELFMEQHTEVSRDRLNIWMASQQQTGIEDETDMITPQDFACVDQDSPMAGVSALPIIVAQCDAVISLVDDIYYERAWCCVEAGMIRQLRDDYSRHLWYEHVPSDENDDDIGPKEGNEKWTLRKSRYYGSMNMAKKKLSFESDRPKVTFLARQCRLLGKYTDAVAWD